MRGLSLATRSRGAERWQTRLLSSTHFFSKISRRFKSVFRIVSISVLLRDKRQRKTEASVPASHFQRRRKRDYEGVGPPTPPYRGSSAPPSKEQGGVSSDSAPETEYGTPHSDFLFSELPCPCQKSTMSPRYFPVHRPLPVAGHGRLLGHEPAS